MIEPYMGEFMAQCPPLPLCRERFVDVDIVQPFVIESRETVDSRGERDETDYIIILH